MPFHIDTDGTRRRYSFQVQQGFGGDRGNVITLPEITGPFVTGIDFTVTLTATATSLLAGGSVSSFVWTKPNGTTEVKAAVKGSSSISFTASGADGDVLTTKVYARDNAGNRSQEVSHAVTLTLMVVPDVTNLTTNIPSVIVADETVSQLSISGAFDPDGGSVTYALTLPAGVTASKSTGLVNGELFSITAVANATVNPTAIITITVTSSGGGTNTFTKRLAVTATHPTANEVSWTTPGSYTWTVPENVYSVCALTVDASGGDVSFGDLGVVENGFVATQRSLPATAYWLSVTYGNGLFVAVASSGNTATSPDGVTWTQRQLPATDYWYSVTYGNGLFVAVASNSIAATSPDGVTWTQRSLPAGTNWNSVTYGNGLFVAVATNSNIAATSPDGVNWTQRSLPVSAQWMSVTYGNGMFVAVASNNIAATSPDGVNWTQRSLPVSAQWNSVTYGNGLFVAVATNSKIAATSPDGINWTQRQLPAATTYWQSVTYGSGMFVAVAHNGNIAATSPDGINWTQRKLPVATYWISVTYGNGMFVAVAHNSTIAATFIVGPTATDADATLTSKNGFSLINPRKPGGFGVSNGVKGIAAYNNDIPTIPGSQIPVVVPPVDGGVRVIWGAGRSFPDNAGQNVPVPASVNEVFAVRLYSAGDPAGITKIDSGVDILNNPGVIWTKARRQGAGSSPVYGKSSIHFRGPMQAVGSTTLSKCIDGSTSNDWYSPSNPIVVSNDGFTVNPASDAPVIYSNNDYVSYSFRRAAKFFDVVTFTVPVEGQSAVVPHSLQCEVGAIIVFKTGATGTNTSGKLYWHRSKPNSFMRLDDDTINEGQYLISSTTDTTFTTQQGGKLSHVGTYTAMVFAHDPSPTGYIQCGMTNGNPTSTVELSWKPQFLMTFGAVSSTGIGGTIIDDRRRWVDSGDSLKWKLSSYDDDTFATLGNTTATGFTTKTPNAVYIAIRSGGYTPPGSGETHTLTGNGILVVPSGVTNLIITGNGGLGVATTFSIPGNGQVTFAGSPSGVTTPPAATVQNKAIPGKSKLVCTYNVPVGGSLVVKWLPWVESATHVLTGSGKLTIPEGVTSITASGRGGPGADGYSGTTTEQYWGETKPAYTTYTRTKVETKPGYVTYTRTWVPTSTSYNGGAAGGDWVDMPTFHDPEYGWVDVPTSHPAEYGWLTRNVSTYYPGYAGGNTTVSSVGGYADCIWYGSSNSATPPVVDQIRAIPAGANRVITYAVASGGSLTIKW